MLWQLRLVAMPGLLQHPVTTDRPPKSLEGFKQQEATQDHTQ
jgi:hypothetical protein